MKVLFSWFGMLGLTLFFAGCASAPSATKGSKNFGFHKSYEPYPGLVVSEYVHKTSGLRVFLVPQAKTEVVAYVTAYDVGSRFEEKGKSGLAHLFEHMMFRGTESFPNAFETLASWGDNFNAYTSRDMTVYYQVVPSEQLENVTKFESERMRKLFITPQGFQQERGAVVSERKMRTEDSPFGRTNWELYMLAFKEHPYRLSPIGLQKDLDASTFEDALTFYQKYYAPNRAVITVVGGFEISKMLNLLEQNYGSFEAVEVKEPAKIVEPEIVGLRKKTIRLKTEAPILSEAVRGLSYDDVDVAPEMLMCVLLADGDIGYLGNTILEKGLVQSVGASCSPSVEKGLSVVSLTGNPKMSASTLEKHYLDALAGFEKWLTKDRVENLKLYFVGSQLKSLREPSDLAESIASSYVASKDPMRSIEFLKKIEQVKYEDVVRRFRLRQKSGKARVLIQPSKVSDPISGS